MGEAGLLGLLTPAEFGGSAGEGGEATAVTVLSEELARACGGIAVGALVSAYMAGPHLVRYGTTEQKQNWVEAHRGGDGRRGHRRHRARRGVGRRGHHDEGPPHRRGLGDRRPQDVHHQRRASPTC